MASVVAMLSQRRNGPRRLRDIDDDEDFVDLFVKILLLKVYG